MRYLLWFVEDVAALVSLALFISTLFVWVPIIGEMAK